MVRTKVFVGNLSFTTKENELAKEFEVAGKVISANIITRGPRSLGYGFVEMDSEADANNAVKLLDKKEVDGRPINGGVAKPREEGADANNAQSGSQQSTRGGSQRPRGGQRGGRGGSRGGSSGQQGQGQQGQGQQGQGQQGQGNQRQSGGQGQQQSQGQSNQGGNGGGFRRRRQDDEEGEDQGQGQRGGRGARGARGGRGGRGPRPARTEGEENRTPSTTTLFVANLPFSLEDDAFGKVLKDSSLAYKTAHVVKKKTGRSKGFGFIEFDNEGDQQKALAALNNKDLEGRALVVKVALTELRTPDDVTNAQVNQVKTDAPTTASTSSPVAEKKDDKVATPKQEQKK